MLKKKCHSFAFAKSAQNRELLDLIRSSLRFGIGRVGGLSSVLESFRQTQT